MRAALLLNKAPYITLQTPTKSLYKCYEVVNRVILSYYVPGPIDR